MSLSKRHISLRFQLAQGSFDQNQNDTFEVDGLRCSASITKAGGASQSNLDLRVFGLPLSVMNKLTILGKPLVDGRSNTVSVLAGSDASGLAAVFEGTISEAWIDANGAPQVSFQVAAFSGILPALKPIAPTSYKGSIDAALAVSALAQENGYSFENSGVKVTLRSPYYPGTMLSQLEAMAQEGDFNFVIDDNAVTPGGVSTGKTIAIWPRDGSRNGEIPLIAPDTGLIGYPTRTENGILVKTLFNPNIVFGGQIQVESSLTPANGRWTVFRVEHDLEAETPGGKWFTSMECSIFGQGIPTTNG